MRDSAFAGFEKHQPEAIAALIESSCYDCAVIAPAILATMIEAGKTGINESSSPST